MRLLFIFSLIGLGLILTVQTRQDLQPIPETLNITGSIVQKPQLLDRYSKPVTITYKNYWNLHDIVSLHEIPEFLQQAFIISEDKRFYQHSGADWIARLHAVWQNITAMTKVRGASTISEQTIKMLHPRSRTIWTRWLEGFEAAQLEQRFSKNEIFEFYLNQVPYSAQRRGVAQAARYYFDRDLETLDYQEMMTLVVLVRAPSRFDPIKHPGLIIPAVERLAGSMDQIVSSDKKLNLSQLIQAEEMDSNRVDKVLIRSKGSVSQDQASTVKASHFAKYVYEKSKGKERKIKTTLDRNLQNSSQQILEQRIDDLKKSNVKNGAVLIVDHKKNEILSWVVAGDSDPDYPGGSIDAVTTPRQPGSTLKPLLYTLALEHGFTAATLIDDSPLSESVGTGLHTYHNYSRQHYGLITLREALGNSLNIPAVKTLQKVGVEKFLKTLHQLGVNSLKKHPDLYGDGLALGNGEITLYELVQAYTTLARGGRYKPLIAFEEDGFYQTKKIFTTESSSLIANILSDKKARRREFGSGGLLNFPIQTAVKTGTSNDYRDAWAIGFNHRYTVGVWMGNMDRESMKKVTGSIGPAFVLRSIFSELNLHQKTESLFFSPRLVKAQLCKETSLPPVIFENETCSFFNEWFIPGTVPQADKKMVAKRPDVMRIQHPSPNLQMAMDPRIPDQKQQIHFSLNKFVKAKRVRWILDGELLAETSNGSYQWHLEKGSHQLRAEILESDRIIKTSLVNFRVK